MSSPRRRGPIRPSSGQKRTCRRPPLRRCPIIWVSLQTPMSSTKYCGNISPRAEKGRWHWVSRLVRGSSRCASEQYRHKARCSHTYVCLFEHVGQQDMRVDFVRPPNGWFVDSDLSNFLLTCIQIVITTINLAALYHEQNSIELEA